MEQKMYPSLDDVFVMYEQDHPRPQSVAPAIPQGEQLGTIDKLAQAIIPRLVDKLNAANWEIEKLKSVCEYLHDENLDLYRIVNDTILPALDKLDSLEKSLAKKPSTKRKPKADKPKVDISEIADYDPDTDTWKPMVVDGHCITGAFLGAVKGLGPAAGQMYSEEILSFIGSLGDDVKAAIAERFPS